MNAVKINEQPGNIDIAVIDKETPEKFSKRLQVFKFKVLACGKLVDCRKMAMVTEPPLCAFAPCWGFVEGELRFISNERIPTKSRKNPDWKSSSEVPFSHFKKPNLEKF